ncbi:MAG: tyrosine-type recombinase/integrase [Limisphaerales bacterium]
MKTQKTLELAAKQPVFHKVAENLYRLESSSGYYALVKKGGKQFRRSLKTKDRKLAERRLKELKAQIGVLTVAKDNAKLTFKEVADAWNDATKHSIEESTETRRNTCINNLDGYFQQMSIRNITIRDCEQWAAKRGAEAAAQTFAHELGVMKAVFKYAAKHGFILSSPAAEIKRKKISNRKIQTPSRDQFQQIVSEMRVSDGRSDSQTKAKNGADLIEFLAYSGARIGEAHAGTWKDVRFDTGEIWLHGKKTEASDRLIPMPKALRLFLERLKKETNAKLSAPIIKIKSARRSLQRACKKLAVKQFSHHDFRHYFATTCIEEGVDIPTVSRWLGHADGGALAMQRYGHLRREHSLAMMQRVSFAPKQPDNVIPLPKNGEMDVAEVGGIELKKAVAKAKSKYRYPWWASENPHEIFWGQLNETVQIVPKEKLRSAAEQAMGREVFASELADPQSLIEEFKERISPSALDTIAVKIQKAANMAQETIS